MIPCAVPASVLHINASPKKNPSPPPSQWPFSGLCRFDLYEWVTSPVRMRQVSSHVTHMSYISMSHVTHMSYISMSYVTHMSYMSMSHVARSYHRYDWSMSLTCHSHIIHTHGLCHTVLSCLWRSDATYMSYIWMSDMSYIWMSDTTLLASCEQYT